LFSIAPNIILTNSLTELSPCGYWVSEW